MSDFFGLLKSEYAKNWVGAGAVPAKGFETSDLLFNPDKAYQDIKYIGGFHMGPRGIDTSPFITAPINPSAEVMPFRITRLPRDEGIYIGGTNPDYMWTEEFKVGPVAYANWLLM